MYNAKIYFFVGESAVIRKLGSGGRKGTY